MSRDFKLCEIFRPKKIYQQAMNGKSRSDDDYKNSNQSNEAR